jgi:hypothetical protein
MSQQYKETTVSYQQTVGTKGYLFNLFNGIRLQQTAQPIVRAGVQNPQLKLGAVRLVVSIVPSAACTLNVDALVLSDSISSPGLQEQNIVVASGGLPFVYEIRWGSIESQINVPNAGGAQVLLGGSLVNYPTFGLRADYSVGGHPDGSGSLNAQLVLRTGFNVPIGVTANCIVWGD